MILIGTMFEFAYGGPGQNLNFNFFSQCLINLTFFFMLKFFFIKRFQLSHHDLNKIIFNVKAKLSLYQFLVK